MKTVNLAEKLAQFSSHWDPHVVADYNGNDVMVVKFIGEFPFHSHPDTDDFFLVLEGEMEMDIEGKPTRSKRVNCLLSLLVSPIALAPNMNAKFC